MHAPDSLNIVHCFRSPVGGIFRHVRDLARAQQAQGHRVGIICDSSTGGDFENAMLADLAPSLALGVHRTAMQRHVGPGDLTAAYRTYNIIKELKPNVLHGHGAKGGVYARVFGSLLRVFRSRVARLYSSHGGSLHYDPDTFTGKVFFLLERILSYMSDYILFVSENERQTYFRKVGKPGCKTELVYNGLNPDEFEPVAPADNPADFLFIGMMRELKGPDLFLDALSGLSRPDGKPVTAIMVGDGEDRNQLIARASELGLADTVSFMMPMPARQAFSLARFVVLSSRAEAMPYTVLEALGAGKIMLATRVGGIPEILGADSPALMEPDVVSVHAAMQAVLDDEARFTAAMPSPDTLRNRFSSKTMADAIIAVYRDILA